MVCGQVSNVLIAAHVVEPQTPAYYGVLGVGTIFSQAVSAFLNTGMMRICLDTARGATPRFEALFSGADRFLPMFLLSLLIPFAFLFGCLVIVPGLILLVIYPIVPYYVVEGGMGPIEALQQTWVVSRGQRWELAMLGLYGFGLNILGVIGCCVGLLATVPLYWVATALVFSRIAGVAPPTPSPGAQGPMQPPYSAGPHDLPPWR
jgi:uncharacterized membrane protein